MLKDYPVKFDNETIFTPSSWEEESKVVESVNETEAGTDQVIATRYDKLSVSARFQCSGLWASKFKAYSRRDVIAVSLYDLEIRGYRTRQMRIRSFKAEPEDGSENVKNTNGLWTVSFSLEEF